MYATHNIHVGTHNLEFLQVFKSRQEAIDHLKKDAESHVAKFRGIGTLFEGGRWINKKVEMTGSAPDGYYLRLSQKHANRIVAYELRTVVKRGYIYNSNTKIINKVYVYGVSELPHETITSKFNLAVGTLKPLHLQSLEELKAYGSSNLSSLTKDHKTLQANPVTHNMGSLDEHINELKACLMNRRIKLCHCHPYLLDN